MTTTNPPANCKAILQRRFPDVDFVVSPSVSGRGLTVSWEGEPDNAEVELYLRGAGLRTESSPGLSGFVRVTPRQESPLRSNPTRRASPKRPTAPRRRTPTASAPPSLGSQGLWSISDLEVIRTTADRWVSGLHSGSTIAYYTGGMTLLMLASGYLAWTLDIRPSLIFGQHLAGQLASEWLNLKLLTAVIFLLSITPNLLEFFATGLAAHGNVIVDLSIKAALLFDAATDAPMAYAIAKAFMGFFITEPGFWAGLGSVLLALPILLFSTVVVEILFLSFLTAWVLLIRRGFETRTPGRRNGR